MSSSQILSLLQNPGMINLKILSEKSSLDVYEDTLNELLEKAKSQFQMILKTPESEISFSSIVEKYLNQDEELSILYGFLHHLNGTCSSEKTRSIVEKFQPKMVEYGNMVNLSPEYFLLLTKLEKKKDSLTPEQKRSLDLLLRDMRIAGVHLKGKKKQRLEGVNQKLSELSQRFSNNILDSRKKFSYHFSSQESLKEMPESDLHAAATEAKERKKTGFVFTLSPPSYQAIMQYCTDSEIRKRFWQANVQIATKGKLDNRPLVLEILQLRKEKANLLGFDTFPEYALQDRMAKTPDQVLAVLSTFASAAKQKAQKEYEHVCQFAQQSELHHWDMGFYSEKLKEKKFHIDNKKLREFFPLEQVISGLFQTAEILFGLTFTKISPPTYSKDVLCYEVYREKKLLSYFIFDLFARPEKRGGAWCNDLRHRRKGQVPIVVNVSNFAKGVTGKPPLLTHYDVQTMFHEFGHGLHVMMSDNTYVNTDGFHTEWDFVELPSQLFENWTWQQEGLELFAKHFETGETIPNETISALSQSRKFLKGLFLLRQNEFGFLDFLLHLESPPKSVEELDAKTLAIANTYSVLKKPSYYRMYASFSHIFSGGYAAGYYSYLWAEILEADVFRQFLKEGILSPKMGKEYAEKILMQGAKKDGAELFQDFMGREPNSDALLLKLGLDEG